MRHVLVCLALSAALTGCHKKSSPEFYKLESEHAVLVAREGDDAYGTPQMAALVAGLQALPENSRELPRAQALLATIATEEARVAASKVRPPPVAAVPRPSPAAFPPPTVEPLPVADAGVVDAGAVADEPVAGMSEVDFGKRFASCFTGGPGLEIPDVGAATTQTLVARPDCEKRFGGSGAATTSFLFVKGQLWGKRTATAQPAAKPVPVSAPPESGEPAAIRLPGAPGYVKPGP